MNRLLVGTISALAILSAFAAIATVHNKTTAQLSEMDKRLKLEQSEGESRDAERAAELDLLRRYVVASQMPATAAVAGHDVVTASDSPSPAKSASKGIEPAVEEKYLDDKFRNQTEDDAWSHQAVREARERLEPILPKGSAVTSVDCRESMCRIESTHSDMTSYRSFVKSAFMNPSTEIWNGATFSTIVNQDRTAGAPLVTVAYVTKDGEALPAMSE